MLNFVRELGLRWTMVIALLLHTRVDVSAQSFRYKHISREVIESRLEKYGGNDQQREATLKQLFAETGCGDQNFSEQHVKGSKLPNVICVLPGSSDKFIIVGAHFDHAPAGDGVVDNWSGASLLPSLYQALKLDPRRHTYVFIGFTDEEKGEVGSRFYARQMTKDQVASTEAMVNMDTLGLGPPEVWASHSDKSLTGALAYIGTELRIPVTAEDVDQVGSTDSVQFSERKIPSITIHSLTQKTWNARILHTSRDQLSAIKVDDYYRTYELLTAYLVFLDQIESVPARSNAR
jgi:Peptidase family M28